MRNRKVLQFMVFGLLSLMVIIFFGQQVSAQDNVLNISGKWSYRAGAFESDVNDLGCFKTDEKESRVTINQNGNQFTSSGGIAYYYYGSTAAIGEGTVRDNQIQSRFQLPNTRNISIALSWSGNISPDKNTISGEVTCISRGTDSVGGSGAKEDSSKFTLTRVSQAVSETIQDVLPNPGTRLCGFFGGRC